LDDTARSVVPFGGIKQRESADHSHLRPLYPREVACRVRVLKVDPSSGVFRFAALLHVVSLSSSY